MEPQMPDRGFGSESARGDSPLQRADCVEAEDGAGNDVSTPPDPAGPPDFSVDSAVVRAAATSMLVALRSALKGVSVMPPVGFAQALGDNWPVFPSNFQAQVTAALTPGLQALSSAASAMPPIIDPAVLRAFSEAMPKIDLSGLAQALDRLHEAIPPNWDSLSQYRELAEIARKDGIPVVWVPPAEVLADLLTAPNRETRVRVLTARRVEVLDSCRQVLAEVQHPDLADRVPQALEAITALESGLPSAAQALAVAVTEAVITGHVAGTRSTKKLAEEVDVYVDELSVAELRGAFALLPVARFYTSWWATSGTPPPPELSRHVTVHLAPASHLTPENALVALMLLSSLLRDVDASAVTAGPA